MKLKILLLLLLLAFEFRGNTPIRITDPTKEYDLFTGSKCLEFNLKDDPGIEAVLLLSWKSSDDVSLKHKNTSSAFYYKTTIVNEVNSTLLSHLYFVSLNKLDIYQVVNGKVVQSKSLGILSDQSQYPLLHSIPFMELASSQGDTFDIVIRLEGIQTSYLPWFVSTFKPMMRMRHYQDIFYGLVHGLFILVIFYNLSLYYRLREADNLLYAIWVFLLSINISFYNGFYYEFINPGLIEGVNLVDIFPSPIGWVHVAFAITFLKFKWLKPWGIVGMLLMAYYLCIALVEFFGQSETFYPWFSQSFIIFPHAVFNLSLGTIALVRGFKPAIFYLLANILFFVFVAVLVAYSMAAAPHNFITYNALYIASALEVVFFSFALSYKIRLLKNEKNNAMAEKTALAIENESILRNQKNVLEEMVETRTTELQEEKMRSDELLLNILPEQTAKELKATGTASAKYYENVSIMFIDFVSFTQAAEELTPDELVKTIDFYFRSFDDIIDKFGLEKIKTIGDAYLAVANLPNKIPNGEKQLVCAALAITEFAKNAKTITGNYTFDVRIGIHSGPVVSGVVGSKKFQFDIWGDAVNIAARMEQNCEPGKVNISRSTYETIKDEFDFVPRGRIGAKNKGFLDMYYVLAKK